MGDDYTSQSRSEFDWYNPQLYIYQPGSSVRLFDACILSKVLHP